MKALRKSAGKCVRGLLALVLAAAVLFPCRAEAETVKVFNGDIYEGVFNDAMSYYGYDVDGFLAEKQKTGEFPFYSRQQRSLGLLSDYHYANVNGTGTETKEVDGQIVPDLQTFNKKGMVCASWVAFIYLNYMTNVAGINMDELPALIDESGYSTRSVSGWYYACEKMVEMGRMERVESKSDLEYGDLIIFRNNSSSTAHIAVSLGEVTWHGKTQHAVMHQPGINTTTGAYYSTVEILESDSSCNNMRFRVAYRLVEEVKEEEPEPAEPTLSYTVFGQDTYLLKQLGDFTDHKGSMLTGRTDGMTGASVN